MSKKSIHTLKPEQLIDLLSIGMDADVLDSGALASDEEIRNYFDRLVHRKIPSQSSVVDSILIFLRENDRYGDSIAGRSLAEVLLDTRTDLDLYCTIKDYSKKIYQTSISKGEYSMAAAIYFVAIAGALAFHQSKISEHSWQTLENAFEDFLSKTWMVPEFRDLLKEASHVCKTEH